MTCSTADCVQVDYPKDSEVFESYECSETQFNTYKLSLLQPAVKALNLSQKTQLRMNQVQYITLLNTLCMQCSDSQCVCVARYPVTAAHDKE